MNILRGLALAASLAVAMPVAVEAATVFDGGTIFISPNVLTSSSPSSFGGVEYGGIDERYMFDRRVNDWVFGKVFLFNASFADGLKSEVRVNMEFGSVDAARDLATYYGGVIGKLPTVLLTDVKSIWINDGVQPFGGGNDSLLIHAGQGKLYDKEGILEETFVHEATHTSLDALFANDPEWLAAQKADGMAISPYAAEFPTREDLAETFLMWMADRYRPDSLTSAQRTAIETGIPNRMAFLDRQKFNMFPIAGGAGAVPEPATWAMMIGGFGLVGGALRRRRAGSVTVRCG